MDLARWYILAAYRAGVASSHRGSGSSAAVDCESMSQLLVWMETLSALWGHGAPGWSREARIRGIAELRRADSGAEHVRRSSSFEFVSSLVCHIDTLCVSGHDTDRRVVPCPPCPIVWAMLRFAAI